MTSQNSTRRYASPDPRNESRHSKTFLQRVSSSLSSLRLSFISQRSLSRQDPTDRSRTAPALHDRHDSHRSFRHSPEPLLTSRAHPTVFNIPMLSQSENPNHYDTEPFDSFPGVEGSRRRCDGCGPRPLSRLTTTTLSWTASPCQSCRLRTSSSSFHSGREHPIHGRGVREQAHRTILVFDTFAPCDTGNPSPVGSESVKEEEGVETYDSHASASVSRSQSTKSQLTNGTESSNNQNSVQQRGLTTQMAPLGAIPLHLRGGGSCCDYDTAPGTAQSRLLPSPPAAPSPTTSSEHHSTRHAKAQHQVQVSLRGGAEPRVLAGEQKVPPTLFWLAGGSGSPISVKGWRKGRDKGRRGGLLGLLGWRNRVGTNGDGDDGVKSGVGDNDSNNKVGVGNTAAENGRAEEKRTSLGNAVDLDANSNQDKVLGAENKTIVVIEEPVPK